MKKILAVYFAIVFLFSLASCGISEKDAEIKRGDEGFSEYEYDGADYEFEDYEDDSVTGEYRIDVEISLDSNFSEGLAFSHLRSIVSDVPSHSFYFDKTGKIVFELDERFQNGEEFHEGYAVVSEIGSDNSFMNLADDANGAVVDKDGEFLFEPGEHNYYARVSEGKIVAFDSITTYSGTENLLTVYDLNKNELWSMKVEEFTSYDLYYLDGILTVGDKCYDTEGNVVFESPDGLIIEKAVSEHSTVCVAEVGSYGAIKVFDRENLEVKDYNFDVLVIYPTEFLYRPFYEGYIAVRDGHDKVHVMDQYGDVNIIELDCTDGYFFKHTDMACWIVQMNNDYYGVIDENGEFLFEPVQEELFYLGDGLFQKGTTFSVCDMSGKEVFNPGRSLTVDDEVRYYSDGMLLALGWQWGSYFDKEGNSFYSAWK